MSLAWGAKVSPLFRFKVVAMCPRLGITNPDHLMACIAFESGRTFSPSVRNPGSSGTGLIQIMRDTAPRLGTTVEALALMTAEEQLDYVEKYLKPYAGRLGTLASLYMAILLPTAIDKPEDAPLFTAGTNAYAANRGLDLNNDKIITKGEAAAYVDKALLDGMRPENIADVPDVAPVVIPDVVIPGPVAPVAPVAPVVVPQPPKEPAMGALLLTPLIGGLVQSLLQAFAPQAQAQLAPVLAAISGATAPPASAIAPVPPIPSAMPASQDAMLQFVQGIMTTALQVAGHANPANATDADKIAATAKVLAQPVLVQQVQESTVDHYAKIAPLLDKLVGVDKQANDAKVALRQSATSAQQADTHGIVKLVVSDISSTKKYIVAGIGLAVVVAAICKGFFPDMPDYVTTLIALGGPIFGSAMKESGAVVAHFFDGTPSSNAENAINAELARK